ncbi:MAG TPA: GDYXXLXY domain-containing protein [Allosphingosinicella sp.]|nr:GDYXXLXY domain-containing protein [Allosphingosinicella sp.]
MRKAILILAGLAILAFVNFGIYRSERLLTEGRIVFLRLSPVDPRSLMQGDYMRLNFEVADRAFPAIASVPKADGHVVVFLDPHNIARFRRFADGRPLGPGEIALRYRIRGGRANFATDAYFFEEGRAKDLAGAAFGAFRVGADGDMILTGLRGPRLEPL